MDRIQGKSGKIGRNVLVDAARKCLSTFWHLQPKVANFWKLILTIAFFASILSGILVYQAVENERRQMIFNMHARAESLMWAIEAGARSMGHTQGILSMLPEMGLQPGIAWIAILNGDGRILVDSNPQLAGTVLYTKRELARLKPDRSITGRFSPDDPDIYETWKIFDAIHRHGKTQGAARYIFVALDARDFKSYLNQYSWHLIIIALLVTIASITAIAMFFYAGNYRASRRELADAQAMAAQVIENYPSALCVADTKGHISICNAPARAMFGMGKQLPDLKDLPCLDWNEILKDLEKGEEVIEREDELIFEDGSVPVSLSAARIFDGRGTLRGTLFVFRNIEEIRLLKDKLKQSRHLMALGNLAAGLAHEIRNPLSSICGYGCYLEQRLKDDPMGKATARLLVEEAQRLNGTLTDLLTLAKPAVLNRKIQSLLPVVEKVYKVAKADADAKNQELSLELPQQNVACEASIDAERLTQALLNIVLNAVQATQPGGNIVIGIDAVDLETKNGRQTQTEKYWRIYTKDNGPGMPEKIQRQIFMPYFTTRANGTGLGLSLAQRIVENHGGMLKVQSLPGKGATFAIFLPAGEK